MSWSNSFFGHSKPDSEDKTSKPKDKPSTITKKKNPTMPPALKSATVIKNLKKEKKQLEEGTCGLEEEKKKLQEANESLTQKCNGLTEEADNLKDKLRRVNKDLDSAKKALDQANQRIQDLQRERDEACQVANDALSQQVANSDDDGISGRSVTPTQVRASTLTVEGSTVPKSEYDTLKREKDTLTSENGELNRQNENLQKENKKLKTDKKALEKELTKMKEALKLASEALSASGKFSPHEVASDVVKKIKPWAKGEGYRDFKFIHGPLATRRFMEACYAGVVKELPSLQDEDHDDYCDLENFCRIYTKCSLGALRSRLQYSQTLMQKACQRKSLVVFCAKW